MKSKLIVSSALLLVWLSSCSDAENTNPAEDGGLGDGGVSATSANSGLPSAAPDGGATSGASSTGTSGQGSALYSDAGLGSEGASNSSAPAPSSDASNGSADSSGNPTNDGGNATSSSDSTTPNTDDTSDPTLDASSSDSTTPNTDDTSDPTLDASSSDSTTPNTDDTSERDASVVDDASSETTNPEVSDDEADSGVIDTTTDPSSDDSHDASSGEEETDSNASNTTDSSTTTDDSSEATDPILLDASADADADTSADSDASDRTLDAGATGETDAGSVTTPTDAGGPDSSDTSTAPDTSTDVPTDTSTDDPSSSDTTSSSDTSSTDTSSTDTTSTAPLNGRQLFEEEQFGGNGRTCLTCHGPESGSISPAEIQALYAADPSGPMFRPIDSNDGVGNDYSILLERATFRVEIALPPGVTLVDDPTARTIVLRRSALSTINTPGLDPTLMWDGRAVDLADQATGAITGHAESPLLPTAEQLALIAEFEQTNAFFSSDTLWNYYNGGAAPQWPPGNTAEEQRGRRWFAEDRVNAPRFNICGQCHGGPMTNETQQNSGLPVGEHFQTANVSEFNTIGNPTYRFRFPDPNNPGQTVEVTTPDPGLALTTGDLRDVNFFKIPTLWGVSKTAPYFHDNSAATLEELMDHYEDHLATFLFRGFPYPFPHVPTAQDKADIIAYMRLL